MSREVENAFLAIADNTIALAEAVKCDLDEFREGLQVILEHVRHRIAAAADEE